MYWLPNKINSIKSIKDLHYPYLLDQRETLSKAFESLNVTDGETNEEIHEDYGNKDDKTQENNVSCDRVDLTLGILVNLHSTIAVYVLAVENAGVEEVVLVVVQVVVVQFTQHHH